MGGERNHLRSNAYYQQLQSERDKALSQLKRRLYSDYYQIGRSEFRQQYGANTVDKAYKDIQSQIKRQSKGKGTKNLRQQIRQLEDLKPKYYKNQATLNFQDPRNDHVQSFIRARCYSAIPSPYVDKPLQIGVDSINDALNHFNFSRTDEPLPQNVTQQLEKDFSYYHEYGVDQCFFKAIIQASLLLMPANDVQSLVRTLEQAFDTIEDDVEDYVTKSVHEILVDAAILAASIAGPPLLLFIMYWLACCLRAKDDQACDHELPTVDQYPDLNHQLTRLIDNEQYDSIKNNLQVMQSSRSQATLEFLQERSDDQLKALAHLPQQQLTKQLMEHVVRYAKKYKYNLTDLCRRINQYHQQQPEQGELVSFQALIQNRFDYDRNNPANYYIQKLLIGVGHISLSPLIGFDSHQSPVILLARDNPQQLTKDTLEHKLKIIHDNLSSNDADISDVIDSSQELSRSRIDITIHPTTQSRDFSIYAASFANGFNLLNTLVTVKALNALGNYSDEDPTLTQQQFDSIVQSKDWIINDFKELYQALYPDAANIYTDEGLTQIIDQGLDPKPDESPSDSRDDPLNQYSSLQSSSSETQRIRRPSNDWRPNWFSGIRSGSGASTEATLPLLEEGQDCHYSGINEDSNRQDRPR